jgi:hypothetical protein
MAMLSRIWMLSTYRNLLWMLFELDLMAASLFFTPSPDARLKLKQCTPIWINKKRFHPCLMAQKG